MEDAIEQLCSKISLTEREKIGISVTEGMLILLRGMGIDVLLGSYGQIKWLTRRL
jgi:hypothetical protein